MIKKDHMAALESWNVTRVMLWIFKNFYTNCLSPSVIVPHTIAHTWTHMQGQTQSTDWTKYFLIRHPPIVIADPWVSLVPALKQQLSFPLPHSSPKCFQWRRKQHLPEGYVHMKFHKKIVWFIFSAPIRLAQEKRCNVNSCVNLSLLLF